MFISCRCWGCNLNTACILRPFFSFLFFPSFYSFPNNKSCWPPPLSHHYIYSNCHFLHRLLLPSLLTLSFLLHLTRVDVNLLVKGKGEWVSEGKAFTPVLPPRGKVSFYRWSSCGAQKSVKRLRRHTHTYTFRDIQKNTENTVAAKVETHTDKITHKHKRHSRGNTLIVYSHVCFLHPAVFFSFIQTMWPLHSPITTTNHKCKSRGHERKDNGESKLNLLFVHICAATRSSEVVLLLILQ